MYLLRHIHRRGRFVVLDETGPRRLGLSGHLRVYFGEGRPPVGTFQWLDGQTHFAAYYCPPTAGRVRLDDVDIAVADVVEADLEDLDERTSRIRVVLRDGRSGGFVYSRPWEPFTLDDWDPGRTRWDMPARIATALADEETRDEWARMEWARSTGALTAVRNNSELWARLTTVRAGLIAAGKGDWAARLSHAERVSAMPGEVLGQTRQVLRELRMEGELPEKHAEVDACLDYLDRQLEGRIRLHLSSLRTR